MKIKLLSLAVLAAVSMGSAQAHIISLTSPGTVHADRPDGEFAYFNILPNATVKDNFFFQLTDTEELKTSASINSEDGPSGDTYTLSLFKYDPNVGTSSAVDQGHYVFSTTSTPHVFMNVAQGDYFYSVWGTNPTPQTDQIAFQSHMVPEPETYAMLLAGLGVLGFVVRRRKVA